jgi:hypothetical protein
MFRTVLASMTLLVACKKAGKPLRVEVVLPGNLESSQVHVTVAGQPLRVGMGTAEKSWDADEAPDRSTLTAELELITPCGPRRSTLAVPDIDENDSQVTVKFHASSVPVERLVLDPALDGVLSIGQLVLPKPFPKYLEVAFADCPKVVKVDGRDVQLPDSTEHTALIARSPARCFRQGVSLFKGKGGSTDRCRPDDSSTLTGGQTYALTTHGLDYLFEGVPEKIGAHEECVNKTWLQLCD